MASSQVVPPDVLIRDFIFKMAQLVVQSRQSSLVPLPRPPRPPSARARRPAGASSRVPASSSAPRSAPPRAASSSSLRRPGDVSSASPSSSHYSPGSSTPATHTPNTGLGNRPNAPSESSAKVEASATATNLAISPKLDLNFMLRTPRLEAVDAQVAAIIRREGLHAEVVVDIYCRPVVSGELADSGSGGGGGGGGGAEDGELLLLERWKILYQPFEIIQRAGQDIAAMYKRMLFLIRSMYSYSRMLPAFRMARQSQADGSFHPGYVIEHKVFAGSAAPSPEWEAPPRSYYSDPIVTDRGQLLVSVFYRNDCDFAFIRRREPQVAMNAHVILDYIPDSQDEQGDKAQGQIPSRANSKPIGVPQKERVQLSPAAPQYLRRKSMPPEVEAAAAVQRTPPAGVSSMGTRAARAVTNPVPALKPRPRTDSGGSQDDSGSASTRPRRRSSSERRMSLPMSPSHDAVLEAVSYEREDSDLAEDVDESISALAREEEQRQAGLPAGFSHIPLGTSPPLSGATGLARTPPMHPSRPSFLKGGLGTSPGTSLQSVPNLSLSGSPPSPSPSSPMPVPSATDRLGTSSERRSAPMSIPTSSRAHVSSSRGDDLERSLGSSHSRHQALLRSRLGSSRPSASPSPPTGLYPSSPNSPIPFDTGSGPGSAASSGTGSGVLHGSPSPGGLSFSRSFGHYRISPPALPRPDTASEERGNDQSATGAGNSSWTGSDDVTGRPIKLSSSPWRELVEPPSYSSPPPSQPQAQTTPLRQAAEPPQEPARPQRQPFQLQEQPTHFGHHHSPSDPLDLPSFGGPTSPPVFSSLGTYDREEPAALFDTLGDHVSEQGEDDPLGGEFGLFDSNTQGDADDAEAELGVFMKDIEAAAAVMLDLFSPLSSEAVSEDGFRCATAADMRAKIDEHKQWLQDHVSNQRT